MSRRRPYAELLADLVLRLDKALKPGDVECVVEVCGRNWAELVRLAKKTKGRKR